MGAMSLELWLIRHGNTTWNAEGRIQGQADSPLSKEGILQAQALAKRLEGVAFDRVYSSDLQRAQRTAKIALPSEREELVLEPRLRERSFGSVEGRKQSDLSPEERLILQAWRQNPGRIRPFGGELQLEVSARVMEWIAELPREGRVLAFSHGGTILALLLAILELDQNANKGFGFVISNASISKLHILKNLIRISSLNDTAHLEHLQLSEDKHG